MQEYLNYVGEYDELGKIELPISSSYRRHSDVGDLMFKTLGNAFEFSHEKTELQRVMNIAELNTIKPKTTKFKRNVLYESDIFGAINVKMRFGVYSKETKSKALSFAKNVKNPIFVLANSSKYHFKKVYPLTPKMCGLGFLALFDDAYTTKHNIDYSIKTVVNSAGKNACIKS